MKNYLHVIVSFLISLNYTSNAYATMQEDATDSSRTSLAQKKEETDAAELAVHIPSTLQPFPLSGNKKLCFLKNIVRSPNIIVGDYTYYYDAEDVLKFERNVLYHFSVLNDRLIIGKFCQIGADVKFIMNGGNHRFDGYSSFPFQAFGGAWASIPTFGQVKRDTVVGNDVWIGYGVTVMPGVSIGDGAIIGALSCVTKTVEPYTVTGGNPAREIRKRFDEETTRFLLSLKWWEWPVEKITRFAQAIVEGNKLELESAQ